MVSMEVIKQRRCLLLFSLLLLAALCGAAAAPCPSNVVGPLTSSCQQYVEGSNPPMPPTNSRCCNMIRSITVPCLCSGIPANVRGLVNKKIVSNVLKGCQLQVPPGSKCAGLDK